MCACVCVEQSPGGCRAQQRALGQQGDDGGPGGSKRAEREAKRPALPGSESQLLGKDGEELQGRNDERHFY